MVVSILFSTMLGEILPKNPVAYITRDLERALGIPKTNGFFIMTNETPFVKRARQERSDIHTIPSGTLLDTHEILAHHQTQEFLNTNGIRHIIVFKTTTAIERIAKEQGLTVLNPPAALANSIEEKITQLSLLPEIRDLFLPFQVSLLKEVAFQGTPFVLQFNHSHTGSGTKYIDSEKTLQELQTQFPDRPVRTAPFIRGPLFTNNTVVTKEKILTGNINYQITGLAPFTHNRFATIGNDWALPYTLLTNEQKKNYENIAVRVGEVLQALGWRGLFGIDVLFDETTNKFWLLEINARQPASATYESHLQKKAGPGMTTMEAHLLALLNTSVEGPLQSILGGAQITQKIVGKIPHSEIQEKIEKELESQGYAVTPYSNTEREQDWLRIQHDDGGFMQMHNTLNAQANKLKTTLEAIL